jgi:cytochrome c556
MRLLFAVATIALLAACREQAAGDRVGESGNDAAPVEATNGTLATSAAAPLGAPVSGDEAKKLMHDRHERMEEIGDAMKLIGRELKGDSPDLGKVRGGAATIARLAPQASGWFPPGTEPDVGKTEAKAEIWQKPEDFAAKMKAFQQAAQRFNAVAQGNDLAAIRAAQGELGKGCKACHDLYREDDH